MRPDSSPYFTGKLDKAAVALSGLCLVHCLLLPLLIALFPVVGFSLAGHETFHQLILILVIPTTGFALGSGFLRHRSRGVAAAGIAGVAALAIAAFVVHTAGSEALERWITVCGGLLIAAAHVGNFRLIRASHAHRHAHRPAALSLAASPRTDHDRI